MSPWEQSGWFADAEAWIREKVTGLGHDASGTLEQVKVFAFGVVLRIHTSAGYYYFKALLPTVQNEAAILLELSRKWQQCVPELVAYDLERRWLLMRDFGGEVWMDYETGRYEQAVEAFARMQLSYTQSPDTFLELGCPNRRLEHLPGYLENVIEAARHGDKRVTAGLSERQLEHIPDILPTFREQIHQLAAFGIPPTLVQQDFQWANIALRDDGFVLYDWQETVVSHPFFSMTRFLDYVPNEAAARQRSLRDAYLGPWQHVADLSVLRKAFAVAQELHFAYLAVRWFNNLPLFDSDEDESVAWALGQMLSD